MTVSELSDTALGLEEWLKDDRVIAFQKDLQQRLTTFLQSEENLNVFEMLSLVGSTFENSAELQGKIRSLHAWHIEPCGLKSMWNSTKTFVSEHKVEIITGVAICAIGIGIAVAAGYSISCSVGGVVVAGAGSVFSSSDTPGLPRSPTPAYTADRSSFTALPKLQLPEDPNELLVTKNGIWCGGEFYSTSSLQTSPYPYSSSENHFLTNTIAHSIAPPEPLAPWTFSHHEAPQNFLSDSKQTFPNTNPKLLNTISQASQFYTSPTSPSNTDFLRGNLPKLPEQESKRPPSKPFVIEGKTLEHGQINWINGIANSINDSKNTAQYLQELSGGLQISGIYNQSSGMPTDVAKTCFIHYPGLSPDIKDLLLANWTEFDMTHANNPDAKILQICHSQGTLHVKNALIDAPQHIRDRVITLALAPAAIVPEELCFQSYNFASSRDPVHIIEPKPKALISACDNEVIIPLAPEARGYLNELIILKRHPDGSWWLDHEAQSPTLRPGIEGVIKEYSKKQGQFKPEDKGKRF